MTKKAELLTVIAVIGSLSWPFLTDFPDASRKVWEVISGSPYDCSDAKIDGNGKWPYGAILVPGSGLTVGPDEKFYPDDFMAVRLDAAAALINDGQANTVVLMLGKRAPELPTDPEVDYLRTSLRQLGRTEDFTRKVRVITETKSIDTVTNMIEARAITKKIGARVSLLTTNEDHLIRASENACAAGIAVRPVAAESVVRQKFVREGRVLPKGNTFIERLKAAFLIFDRDGRVMTTTKSLLYGTNY